MADYLHQLDLDVFFLINGAHNAFFDKLMWLVSGRLTWVPLYLIFLWLLYREYRKQYWKVLVSIVVMILLSDQVCNLFKDHFMRLRPSNDPLFAGMIHLVNTYTGGMYGFYSAHASNSFAVAWFMVLMLKNNRKSIAIALLSWAALVSYSRIYLGVHYPSDVMTGTIMGILIATLVYLVFRWGINSQKKGSPE